MKISIALCTFNGEEYLAEQLLSIAAQSRTPDELVICDDLSSDKTLSIITRFASDVGFPVHFHVNRQNVGSTANFAKAIALCDGDIIALSDQDDVWAPEKLERLASIFSTHEDIGLVFTDAEVVDLDLHSMGSNLWDWTFSRKEQELFNAGRPFEVLMKRNVVTGATMAFRSRFRELILPFHTDTRLIHDGWIALIIAAVAEIVALPERLIKYRQHSTQQLGIDSSARNGLELCNGKLVLVDETPTGRARYYAEEIRKMEQVCQRLRDAHRLTNAELTKVAGRIKTLTELIQHYQVRGTTNLARRVRASLILKELSTLRYHRYSRGFRSAALDLLR